MYVAEGLSLKRCIKDNRSLFTDCIIVAVTRDSCLRTYVVLLGGRLPFGKHALALHPSHMS